MNPDELRQSEAALTNMRLAFISLGRCGSAVIGDAKNAIFHAMEVIDAEHDRIRASAMPLVVTLNTFDTVRQA